MNHVPDPPPKQFECVLKRKDDNKQIEQPKSVTEIKNQLQKSEQPQEPCDCFLNLFLNFNLINNRSIKLF